MYSGSSPGPKRARGRCSTAGTCRPAAAAPPPARPSPKNRASRGHFGPLHPPRPAPPRSDRLPPARRQIPAQQHAARRAHLHGAVPGDHHRHPLGDHPPAAVLVRLQLGPRIRLRAAARPARTTARAPPRPSPRRPRRPPRPAIRSADRANRTTPPPGRGSAPAHRPGHPRPLRAPRRQPGGVRAPPAPRRAHGPQPLAAPPNRPPSPTAPGHDRPCCSACHRTAPMTVRRSTAVHPWSGPHLHRTRDHVWARPGARSRSHGIVRVSRVTRTPQHRARDARTRTRTATGSRPMTSAAPQPLWQPDPDRIAARPDHPVPGLGGRAPRRPAPTGGYAALHRWSVDELDTFWQAVAEWFDVRFSTPYETVLGRPRHARRPVVPRRHPQLRRARPARRRGPRARRRPRPAARGRDPRTAPRHLGRAAPPGRLPRRRAARASAYAPATASAATSPTSRRPSSPSSPPPPSAASGPPARPTSAPAASSTASSRSSRSSCSPSTATATAARSTTAATPSPNCAANCPRLRAVVHVPLLGTPAPEGALEWSALTSADARTRLRAGALRPPAVGALLLRHHRPAQGHRPVPGRHPRSSTSSSSACTATSAPRTASSGTPPPAG